MACSTFVIIELQSADLPVPRGRSASFPTARYRWRESWTRRILKRETIMSCINTRGYTPRVRRKSIEPSLVLVGLDCWLLFSNASPFDMVPSLARRRENLGDTQARGDCAFTHATACQYDQASASAMESRKSAAPLPFFFRIIDLT